MAKDVQFMVRQTHNERKIVSTQRRQFNDFFCFIKPVEFDGFMTIFAMWEKRFLQLRHIVTS